MKIRSIHRFVIFLSAFVILIFFSCSRERGKVEFYPPVPGAKQDHRLKIKVNGRSVESDFFRNYHPLRMNHFYESGRVRFAADGKVDIRVDIGLPFVSEAFLGTAGKDIPLIISDSAVSFSLTGPGNYYLLLPDLGKPGVPYTLLFFIDDINQIRDEELLIEKDNYVSVFTNGIVSDPVLDQTTKIQQLLDQEGNIRFPRGIYRTGNLSVRSNTNLYLDKGALLKGTDRYHLNDPSAFIRMDSAANITLHGQGVIDANGTVAFDSLKRTTIHGFNISGCRNVHFKDFTVQGTNSWCIDIRYSKGFTADNVKIFSGKDGVDPDASHDVSLKNLSIQSLDDAIAVKNRYPDKSTTERILMKNCIVTSLKSSLKVGTETRALIKDVTFEDIDVYYGERGIVLYAMDGGPVENITWRNIRMSFIDWVHETQSGAAFHFIINERRGKTPVRNCLIENVSSNFLYRSQFAGLEGAPLDGVIMRNIQVVVDQPKRDSCYLFEANENVELKIENLQIDWKNNREKWAGVSSGSGIVIVNK